MILDKSYNYEVPRYVIFLALLVTHVRRTYTRCGYERSGMILLHDPKWSHATWS